MLRTIDRKDIETIDRLTKEILGADGYRALTRLGGMTNHTYHVSTEKGEYLLRIAGQSTEAIISRANERISNELACRLGIDAEMIYFGDDGIKIMKYLPDAVTMTPALLKQPDHIRRAAHVLKTLHSCGQDTGVHFDVIDMAQRYERFIEKNHLVLFTDQAAIKQKMMDIRSRVEMAGLIQLAPCHNDTWCENWLLCGERLYLVDWEYAGMNDPMWDLADLSLETEYDEDQDQLLLRAYFGRDAAPHELQDFWANKLYQDYFWSLWGIARIPVDGQEMQAYAARRYERLKQHLDLFERRFGHL